MQISERHGSRAYKTPVTHGVPTPDSVAVWTEIIRQAGDPGMAEGLCVTDVAQFLAQRGVQPPYRTVVSWADLELLPEGVVVTDAGGDLAQRSWPSGWHVMGVSGVMPSTALDLPVIVLPPLLQAGRLEDAQ